jgi:hypothetical protein
MAFLSDMALSDLSWVSFVLFGWQESFFFQRCYILTRGGLHKLHCNTYKNHLLLYLSLGKCLFAEIYRDGKRVCCVRDGIERDGRG